jgi:peptide deformylase
VQLVTYPHPTLRHVSQPIKRVDSELRELARQMLDMMYKSEGIGLAANQVDLPLRMFVMNLEGKKDKGLSRVFINPVISHPKGTAEREEGCLSIPSVFGPVKRPERVRLSAYTIEGEEFDEELDGLFARVVQHETDHLDGVLFPDRMAAGAFAKIAEDLEEFEIDFDSRRAGGGVPSDEEIAKRLAEIQKRYC